jgi:methyl-accepting chemotaxis protein
MEEESIFMRTIFSWVNKLHQRTHLPIKITVPFVIILFLSVSTIGWLFYSQAKQTIIGLVEARLEAETKSVTEKITLLQYAFASNKKQFDKRLVYELRQQEARMAQKGLSINQFIVTGGTFQPIDKVTKNKITLPAELAKQLEQKQNGVTHVNADGVDYTLAYAFSAETRYIYVMSIPDKQYLAPLTNTANLIVACVVVSLMLSMVFGWYVVKNLTSPFRVLIEVMKKVSEGNLTERTKLEQEGPELRWIAISFNFMMEQMSQIIKEIKQMIAQLNAGGEQMQESAEEARAVTGELSSRLDMVRSGVEQTAASTETANQAFSEMKAAIDLLFQRITSVAKSCEQMRGVADDGQQQMDQVTAAMHEFSTVIHQLDRRMTALRDHSQSIGQVVDLIKNIAKQTKMLALNATIEAARAGEAGRGFAVVAGEVAKLAGESEQATVHIARLIGAIQQETAEAASAAQHATRHLNDSSERIDRTEQAFRELRVAIAATNEAMDTLTEGLTSIASGLSEVDRTIDTFTSVSQETLGSTEQMMAAASKQLESIEKSKELADNLIHLSSRLDQLCSKFIVA